MSFQVARNIELVHSVADYYDQDPRERDEDDDYADALDDDAFERDALAIWDAVNKRWVDA